MIAEQQAQQEVLQDEAYSFENVAIDSILGPDENGDDVMSQRAKLNLINVMNNKKVDQKSEKCSVERSCERIQSAYEDLVDCDNDTMNIKRMKYKQIRRQK